MEEYCVGVTIHNCFYVEAKSQEEAKQKVRDMTNDEIMVDCDFNIEYADPTEGEIAWKLKQKDLYLKNKTNEIDKISKS